MPTGNPRPLCPRTWRRCGAIAGAGQRKATALRLPPAASARKETGTRQERSGRRETKTRNPAGARRPPARPAPGVELQKVGEEFLNLPPPPFSTWLKHQLPPKFAKKNHVAPYFISPVGLKEFLVVFRKEARMLARCQSRDSQAGGTWEAGRRGRTGEDQIARQTDRQTDNSTVLPAVVQAGNAPEAGVTRSIDPFLSFICTFIL